MKIYNDRSIEISIDDDTLQKNKKYYRIIEVPKDTDIETAKCTYRNGILEITFKQKKRYPPPLIVNFAFGGNTTTMSRDMQPQYLH